MNEARARPMLARREVLLGGAMLLTAAAAWERMPRQRVVAVDRDDVDNTIPRSVADWGPAPDDGLVLPSQDEQFAAKVYENQILRTFVHADSPAIMFVLAYDRAQSGMLMVHRPESCYPGSGFTITSDRPVSIPLAPGLTLGGRFLSTQLESRIEQVLYWTRLGNEFPQSWDEERRFLALQNLRGLAPDGALVRLSTIDPDAESARIRLIRFAASLYSAARKDGRALLAGPVNASAGMV